MRYLAIVGLLALLAVPALAGVTPPRQVPVTITVDKIAELSCDTPATLVYSSGSATVETAGNISWRSNCNLDLSVDLLSGDALPEEIWLKIKVRSDAGAVLGQAEWKRTAGVTGYDPASQLILSNLAPEPAYGVYHDCRYSINGGSGFPAAPDDYNVTVVWTIAVK